MTTKGRIKRVEKSLHAQEPVSINVRVVWTDEERLTYDGRKISEEEYDSLVKEGKIRVIGWPEGDGEY